MKRSPLRRYDFMKRRSEKVVKAQPSFQKVYDEVDRRSEGRCEWLDPADVVLKHRYHETTAPALRYFSVRCSRRASEHHHTVKPRRSPANHTPDRVIHLCHEHHDRCSWPYPRGKAVATGLGHGRFACEVVYAADKFQARGQG